MAADTPYALIMDLHSRHDIDVHSREPTSGITIVRAPGLGEPLLVGLG
ncbi:MAG TPA: hypothetical protein VNE62_03705 [Actinomycetota bacterium]|nr:hypothetical protein [Actinomycetota bacterium]